MKIILPAKANLTAPANSKDLYLSSYIQGASGAIIPLQYTKDDILVVFNENDLGNWSGKNISISNSNYSEIEKENVAFKFSQANPLTRGSLSQISSLSNLLNYLPTTYELLLDLSLISQDKHENTLNEIKNLLSISGHRFNLMVNCIDDLLSLRNKANPNSIYFYSNSVANAIKIISNNKINSLVLKFSKDILTEIETSKSSIQKLIDNDKLKSGIILDSVDDLSKIGDSIPFVVGIIDEKFPMACNIFTKRTIIKEASFSGKNIDTNSFSFGYARANKYCLVYQDDGVHIDISEYIDSSTPPANDIEKRLQYLQTQVLLALRETTTYSGGGVGYIHRLPKNFSVEIDITSQKLSQASTKEIAVVNVDPGRNMPSYNPDGTPNFPNDPHEKHSFYDTHGSSPYVGSEQDENDGFRINWNMGKEYDDNQYGRSIGNRAMLAAKLRLQKRGSYFAAYYCPKGNTDEMKWVCIGTIRNDSVTENPYLRCSGKRWQKADPTIPGKYLPVVSNHYIFQNLKIERFD